GSTGITGAVTSSNSLVGNFGNRVGSGGVVTLTNGNYVVSSPMWARNAGAVTWGNGITGITGLVTDSNSLVGTGVIDSVGSGGVAALTNGNYV
ncbi:MAG TPA: hypothetical protein DCL61_24255, partial [Cyanobacteria bacterium UBA12227]|nr:hypothetical protein [Cyanobacteria bacterium UBA12227]